MRLAVTFGSAALCLSSTTFGQTTAFQSSDVVGLRLGDTPEKVTSVLKDLNSKAQLVVASVGTSGFTTPMINFGFVDERGMTGPDEEILTVTLDYPEQKHVVSIHRWRNFYNVHPQIETVMSQLEQKYGKPAFQHEKRLYWTTNLANNPNKKGGKFIACSNAFQTADWYAQGNLQVVAQQSQALDPSCGTWLVVTLNFVEQSGAVTKIDETFTDTKALSYSVQELTSQVKTGASEAERKAKEQRSGVRAPL